MQVNTDIFVYYPAVIQNYCFNCCHIIRTANLEIFLYLLFCQAVQKQNNSYQLNTFIGFYNYDWTGICAAMIVQSLPMLIIFVFLQKYFLSGVVAGAVKG